MATDGINICIYFWSQQSHNAALPREGDPRKGEARRVGRASQPKLTRPNERARLRRSTFMLRVAAGPPAPYGTPALSQLSQSIYPHISYRMIHICLYGCVCVVYLCVFVLLDEMRPRATVQQRKSYSHLLLHGARSQQTKDTANTHTPTCHRRVADLGGTPEQRDSSLPNHPLPGALRRAR